MELTSILAIVVVFGMIQGTKFCRCGKSVKEDVGELPIQWGFAVLPRTFLCAVGTWRFI